MSWGKGKESSLRWVETSVYVGLNEIEMEDVTPNMGNLRREIMMEKR